MTDDICAEQVQHLKAFTAAPFTPRDKLIKECRKFRCRGKIRQCRCAPYSSASPFPSKQRGEQTGSDLGWRGRIRTFTAALWVMSYGVPSTLRNSATPTIVPLEPSRAVPIECIEFYYATRAGCIWSVGIYFITWWIRSGFPGGQLATPGAAQGWKDALKWDVLRSDGVLIGVNVHCSFDRWTLNDVILSTTRRRRQVPVDKLNPIWLDVVRYIRHRKLAIQTSCNLLLAKTRHQ